MAKRSTEAGYKKKPATEIKQSEEYIKKVATGKEPSSEYMRLRMLQGISRLIVCRHFGFDFSTENKTLIQLAEKYGAIYFCDSGWWIDEDDYLVRDKNQRSKYFEWLVPFVEVLFSVSQKLKFDKLDPVFKWLEPDMAREHSDGGNDPALAPYYFYVVEYLTGSKLVDHDNIEKQIIEKGRVQTVWLFKSLKALVAEDSEGFAVNLIKSIDEYKKTRKPTGYITEFVAIHESILFNIARAKKIPVPKLQGFADAVIVTP